MKYPPLTAAIVMTLMLWGCGKNNDTPPPREETPYIAPPTLTVKEGEQATATVVNAKDVGVAVNDYADIFTIETEGVTITVHGLKPGEGKATVRADDSRLTLRVTVTAKSEDESYDFAPELADNRTRFVSERITMMYDLPGTIASRKVNGIVEMRDLNNGNYLEFEPGSDSEGRLPKATLKINGEIMRLEECSLEWKASEADRWYRMKAAGYQKPIVLVVTGL